MKKRRETLPNYVAPEEIQSSKDSVISSALGFLASTGMMIQDSSRNANIIPVTLKDEPDKVRGERPPSNHIQQSIMQGNGAQDIQKLMELYSGKSMSDFLAQHPVSPNEAFKVGTPGGSPTESYRFDIINIGYEEKCKRRQFPGDRNRD